MSVLCAGVNRVAKMCRRPVLLGLIYSPIVRAKKQLDWFFQNGGKAISEHLTLTTTLRLPSGLNSQRKWPSFFYSKTTCESFTQCFQWSPSHNMFHLLANYYVSGIAYVLIYKLNINKIAHWILTDFSVRLIAFWYSILTDDGTRAKRSSVTCLRSHIGETQSRIWNPCSPWFPVVLYNFRIYWEFWTLGLLLYTDLFL